MSLGHSRGSSLAVCALIGRFKAVQKLVFLQKKIPIFLVFLPDRKALLGGLLRIRHFDPQYVLAIPKCLCSESARSRITSVRTSLLGTYLAGARYGTVSTLR